MSDPIYVDDPENDGGEFQIPKWRIPKTDMQRRLLQSVGIPKYWPMNSKELRSRFILAEKSTSPVSKIVPEWPLEWFEHCVNWAIRKRKKREMVGLIGLLHLYLDDDARRDFREKLTPSKQEDIDEEFE